MRPKRKIIAVSVETGERKTFEGIYQASKALGTSSQNIMQAIARRGVCCGWKVYDSAEAIRAMIGKLEEQLKEVESL